SEREPTCFTRTFGTELCAPPLSAEETRLAFIRRYAEDSDKRLARLREEDVGWWKQDVAFFDTIHSHAWIMVRRIAHTAHHRAEQPMLLILLGHQVLSV